MKFIITVTMVLATSAQAANISINQSSGSGDCPSGWSLSSYGSSESCCCYGAINSDKNGSSCCVTDDFGSSDPTCVAKIPFTASDYSSAISSVCSVLVGSSTAPASNTASQTNIVSATSTFVSAVATGSSGASTSGITITTPDGDNENFGTEANGTQTSGSGSDGADGTTSSTTASTTSTSSDTGNLATPAAAQGIFVLEGAIMTAKMIVL